MRIPYILNMRMVPKTSLSSGKTPGRPPDSDLVGKTSKHAAPSLYPGGIGTLEDKATALGVLGMLKKEGDLLPLSLSPTLIFGSALWEDKNGRNGFPTHTFGMRDVKEESSHMKKISVDRSSVLSLLGSLDPYWKSQLLLDYSKDLHTCMILDDQLQEEGYSLKDEVIYYHGRIFLSRASKLKEKLLHTAHQDFLFSHTYSMRAYHTIMEGYTWEGFEEEIYQHFRRCMDHVEMEEVHNSLGELSQPPLSSFGIRVDLSMSHPIFMRRVYGNDHICMHNDVLDDYFHSFTMYV